MATGVLRAGVRLWLNAPPSAHRGARRTRLLAVLAVRNARAHLPGLFANLAPQVDGVIALDDGSSDGSADYLRSRPEVLELMLVPPDRPRWDEMGNHRALVAAAIRHGADWVLSIDADERVERQFRGRAERIIRRAGAIGIGAVAVHLRELWDSPSAYRVDGLWGRKTRARLFRAMPAHEFDTRELHGTKAPLQARHLGVYPLVDLNIYHLGMLHEADRAARRERYERADPEARWQPGLGYAYLTETRGLRLRRIPRRRDYRP